MIAAARLVGAIAGEEGPVLRAIVVNQRRFLRDDELSVLKSFAGSKLVTNDEFSALRRCVERAAAPMTSA